MEGQLLAKIPLFSKLDSAELSALASLLREKAFPANQAVFWIGDQGDELFLIRSGRVQVSFPDETGVEKVLAVLGPGQFFGDLSLLDGGRRTASIRTIEPCETFVLSRADFLHYLQTHPHAGVDVLSVLAERQRDILEKLRGVTNANQIIAERTTTWQKIADFIAAISANQWFVAFHVVWFGGWILVNLFLRDRAPDPFPFGLLTMIVSLEAIFLSIFVLVSQNRSGEKDRIRADADYQVNLKAQHEIMQLHQKLDRLTAAMAAKQEG
jgi:CRP/FNR family transcriptional regulator, cyclic AMP receptor protein